ncbi:hypothetical protein CMI48_04775 [Candidatus Pacearchaeota archaeon]|nr:hypothetical protein [Candidatus Pacearchaeota archaeon]
MRLLMLFVLFLLFGVFFVVSEQGVGLDSVSGREAFVEEFGGWVDQLGGNVHGVTGAVVGVDWLPDVSKK